MSEEQTAAVAEQRDGATPLPVDDRPGDTVESDLDAIQVCEDENVQAVIAKDGVELPLPEASKDTGFCMGETCYPFFMTLGLIQSMNQ